MKELQFQIGGTIKLITEPSKAGAYLTLRYQGLEVKAKGDFMAYKLPDDKKVGVQISYVDSKGNPAVVDGDVAWTSSDESIVTVTVDPSDSTKASVAAVGPIGQAQINAVADADLGDGIRNIQTLFDVEVISGEAVAGTITPVGDPEPA